MRGSLPLIAITAAASTATYMAVLAGWSPADAANAVRMALQHELESRAQDQALTSFDAAQHCYGTELPAQAPSLPVYPSHCVLAGGSISGEGFDVGEACNGFRSSASLSGKTLR